MGARERNKIRQSKGKNVNRRGDERFDSSGLHVLESATQEEGREGSGILGSTDTEKVWCVRGTRKTGRRVN